MRFPKLNANARMCLIGAFVFALFGVFMFPWMSWTRRRVEAMTKWPAADAEIVATDTTWTYSKNEGTKYRQKLAYRFVVKNRTYIGDRVSYGGSPPEWCSDAEAKRALPAVGSKIQIRFDPSDPTDSVIHVMRLPDSDDLMLRCLAGGLGSAGGLLMVAAGIAWRAERK